jgi:O-acetyl-ADP-ribose deacetylase (regulator of RNase III)/predicted DNA-binding WGR domain protein
LRGPAATGELDAMAGVKAYKVGEAGSPSFPDDFEVVRKAVLQVTDIKTNRNKYYAIELHSGGGAFRVFTHYGRTDDLETNPDAGAKENRFFDDLGAAGACYDSIYKQKTSAAKGYKELSLASSKIGSQKARGTSAGEVDAKTIAKIAEQRKDVAPPPKSTLAPSVQSLVEYIYQEATNALTSTVAAKITANGIETPLGVLTLGQIERGEAFLQELFALFKSKSPKRSELERLSGEFYTCIPHRIGRTRAAVDQAVIASMEAFEQKQETLQLMKDMLSVNGDASVLYDSKVDKQFEALRCHVSALEPGTQRFQEIEEYVLRSQVKSKTIKVKNVYLLNRPDEWDGYDGSVGNERWLFHGSRITNWVGLLSRGILMPKIVVSMGVNRTDAGWLGNGLYFGDAACTSAYYTTAGKRGTRLMAIARVALGKAKDYTKITYGLEGPPEGYDSCHGVRHTPKTPSQFADDEYVVYRSNRQRLETLIELTALPRGHLMLVRVSLVDVNPKMVAAWRATFEENPEVDIATGSMLDQAVSAWVTPTNGKGSMDGGLDAVLKRHFGPKIEVAVQKEIARLHGGTMPVGHATCVETGKDMPRYLISTPTMGGSSEDISDTLNVALACSAAFQAVHMQNSRLPGSIRAIALPGLGANTGKVPVEICADLMWTAYNLFREHEFTDFGEMRKALEAQLGDLGTGKGKAAKPAKAADEAPKAAKADFDDHEDDEDEDEDFDDKE